MSERSEPKQVCRRSALAFLGCAAAFGLVASSAVLTVSRGGSPSHHDARHAHDAARRYGEVWHGAPSGTAKRGEQNGVRNDARDAQSGVRSGAQDATSDGTRATAPPPPSKKSNRSFGPTTAIGPPQRGPRKAVQRAGIAGLQEHGPPRASAP